MLSKDDKQQPDSRTRAKILKKRSTKIECDIYQSKLEALTTGEKILNKNKKTKNSTRYLPNHPSRLAMEGVSQEEEYAKF